MRRITSATPGAARLRQGAGRAAALLVMLLSAASQALAQAPPPPALVSPSGSVDTGTPTYTWNAISGVTEYQLQVFRGSVIHVNVWLNASSVCTGGTCAHTPSTALTPHDYQWKVRSKNASGTGSWSAPMNFNAAPTNWNGSTCAKFALGDFNGDGRADRLCQISGVVNVSLATAEGFTSEISNPASWVYAAVGSTPSVADVDRDGKADLIFYDNFDGKFWVSKSLGTSFQDVVLWGTASAGGTTCRIDGYIAGTGDMNGDGLVDVFCKLTTSGKIYVGLHNGTNGFSFSQFANYTCHATSQRVGVVDLDGDGKDDWYCMGGDAIIRGLLSNGSSFQASTFDSYGPFCTFVDWQIADLNADGKPDIMCAANGKVAFSTGRSFAEETTFAAGGCTPSKYFPADLDGDGVVEIVCNTNGAPTNDIQVRRWNGTSLSAAATWKSNWCLDKVFAADFTGDGKTDLLCDTNQSVVSAGTAGVQADLLEEVQNGLGGTTTVTYAPSVNFPDAQMPSPSFPNTNNVGVRHLVTALTVEDGRGGSSTLSFSYYGGRMDAKERQFLGYAKVKSTSPCLAEEMDCPYTETWYSQNLPSLGSPTLVERRDGTGTLLAKTASTYSETVATVLPRKALLTRVDNFTYGSGGASKHTYATFTHDTYGNKTQAISYGEAGLSGDELQTDSIFTVNTGAYIVSRVGRIEQRLPGGPLLAAKEFLYDGATSYTNAPVKGNLTKVRGLKTAPSTFVSRTIGYDSWGNPTSVTDETNRTVTTTFDGTHHLFAVKVENGASETVTTTWDQACGLPTQVTDANSKSTTMQYDTLCRRTRTDLPPSVGGYEIASYLNLGDSTLQRTRVETPPATGVTGNNWTEAYFDGLGRTYLTKKRGPTTSQTIVTERTYNSRGAVATSTAPYYEGGNTQNTTYEYDALDRATRVVHPDGNDVQTAYGLWEVTTTDENGKSATAGYDAYGRAIVRKRNLGAQVLETESTYDPLGRLTGMTDPLGNAWSWTFDALGRMTARSDPDAGSWSYAYDDAGRMISQTDAKSQTTTFTYDSLVGRATGKTSGVGTTTLTYSQPRSGFDNVGRVTTINSPGTTLKIDYDALGRAVKNTRTIDAVDYVFQKRFDASGSVTGLTYPDGYEVGPVPNPITYDSAGRLKTVPGFVTNVLYDAAGQPTQRTNANSTQTIWTYTPERGFLTAIDTSGPAVVQDLDYLVDDVGMVTQVTSTVTNEGWSYQYDDLYRLTQATNLSTPSNTQSWTYDELGRISYNSRVGNYSYPAVGLPRPHGPSSVNGVAYTYDANGNRCSEGGASCTTGGQRFSWDADNRISQVTVGSASTTFNYDASGERIKKTATGVTSIYPLGDDYEVTNGTITKYISIGGLGVVAKRVGTTNYWLHTDRLGNIQAITDSTGAMAQRRTYRPYGEKIADTTGHVESRGWIDQREDETGLTYLHARYYDPQVATFLSPDPIGPRGGLNSFAYAFGNPSNFSDRTGLNPDEKPPSVFPSDITCWSQLPGQPGCPGSQFQDMSTYWSWAYNNSVFSDLFSKQFPIVGGFENNVFAWLRDKAQERMDRRAARLNAGENPPVQQTEPNTDPPNTDNPNTSGPGSGPTTIITSEVGGVEIRLEVGNQGLVGAAVQLTGAGSVTLGDYTVPANTFAAVRLDGEGLEVATSNPIQVDGFLLFNGTVSFLRFDGAGNVATSNATVNWAPDAVARWWTVSQIGNQEAAVRSMRRLLLAGRW